MRISGIFTLWSQTRERDENIVSGSVQHSILYDEEHKKLISTIFFNIFKNIFELINLDSGSWNSSGTTRNCPLRASWNHGLLRIGFRVRRTRSRRSWRLRHDWKVNDFNKNRTTLLWNYLDTSFQNSSFRCPLWIMKVSTGFREIGVQTKAELITKKESCLFIDHFRW